jgi:DNA-binding MarR family transcriptional regulator
MEKLIKKLIKKGLVKETNGFLSLTKKGKKKANQFVKFYQPYYEFLQKLDKIQNLNLTDFELRRIAIWMYLLEHPKLLKESPLNQKEKAIATIFLSLKREGIEKNEKRKEELEKVINYIG